MSKIAENVREVLSLASIEGTRIKIPNVDEDTYKKVRRVLEGFGAKWDSSARAHTFDSDPKVMAEKLKCAVEKKAYADPKRDYGFFPTPNHISVQMASAAFLKQGQTVLEPSAGHGSIAEAAAYIVGKANVKCIEILPENVKVLRSKGFSVTEGDFLSMRPDKKYDVVLINPPFADQQDLDHVLHALHWVKPGGRLIAILGAGAEFRTNSKTTEFWSTIQKVSVDFDRKSLPPGTFKDAGTMVHTIFVTVRLKATDVSASLPPLPPPPAQATNNTLAKDLTDLIQKYGPAMAAAAEKVLVPLHRPGIDPEYDMSTVESWRTRHHNKNKPFKFFPSQRTKITALVKGLKRHPCAGNIAEPGSGKSPMSLGVAYQLFRHKPTYKALTLCPGHIVMKWKREIEMTVPNVMVRVITKFSDLIKWREMADMHWGPSYAVISKETAKLGFDVDRPCAARRMVRQMEIRGMGDRRLNTHLEGEVRAEVFRGLRRGESLLGWATESDFAGSKVTGLKVSSLAEIATCPHCGTKQKEDPNEGQSCLLRYSQYIEDNEPRNCSSCQSPLRTNARGFRKTVHIDRFIQRKMKGYFDLLIADEVHELASADTIQGNTFGTLVAAAKYTMYLTGTLIGGKAEDLHAILWRTSPELMRARGFDLKPLRGGKLSAISRNTRGFVSRYGVLEHVEIRGLSDDHDGPVKRGACGRKKEYKSTERVRPGISPDLFNHFLIGRCVFMSLAELGPELPSLERILTGCDMTPKLRDAYDEVDQKLLEAIQERKGGKGPPVLCGIRIQALDAYGDKPWGWNPITAPSYDDNGNCTGSEVVCVPEDLGENREDSKDAEALRICKSELKQGRKCCIYPQFTGKHDVRPKLQRLLQRNGIRATILPDTVKPRDREEWIEEHVEDIDVLIVHPKRVMTGLDLVWFPSLIWYQLGYSTHVLRQGSCRARRPIQTMPCKVFFLYYKNTVQELALGIMGEKEAASQALEGTFDLQGLNNMMNGGEDSDIMAALAHSIGKRIDVKAAWAKVSTFNAKRRALFTPPPPNSFDFGNLFTVDEKVSVVESMSLFN